MACNATLTTGELQVGHWITSIIGKDMPCLKMNLSRI